MSLFVSVVLAVLTFAFIVYPFFKQRLRSVDSVEDENLQGLYFKRDTTYSMLKELEFDLQSGALIEEDYRDLESRYKKKAVSILKDIDDLKKGTSVEDGIEKQVLKLRRGKGPFCPQCGARLQQGNRFCPHCGVRLGQGRHVD